MLAIYAYGTNTGIRAVAAGGGHGHTEDEIRYVRRRYLTRDTAQAVAIGIANATFAARQQTIWGEGSTAVASDSTHFRSYDQNIFTEWHSRYGGRGILIYWHVERGSMVVHSQTLRAAASEVHAKVEGAIGHGTTMKVEGNYVDTHGQSEIGFGITRLLGFDLLPRATWAKTGADCDCGGTGGTHGRVMGEHGAGRHPGFGRRQRPGSRQAVEEPVVVR
jgi:TnpA family transposase